MDIRPNCRDMMCAKDFLRFRVSEIRLCILPVVFIFLLATGLFLICAPIAWADECPAGGSHDYEAELITPSTDDSDGLQRFTCLKCGDTFDQVIPATGHAWGPWQTVVEPTCESSGVERRVCETDTSHVEERVVGPLSSDGSHAWVEIERDDATCTENGWVRYRCSRCGDEKTDVLDALGHDWGAWTVIREATTDSEGLERRTCAHDARHVEERSIPKITQTDTREGSEPTANPQVSSSSVAVKPEVAPQPEPDSKPEVAPQPEAERVDPWAPNALDAVLLGADIVGAAAFAFVMIPLVHMRRWVLQRQAMAKAAAWKEVDDHDLP